MMTDLTAIIVDDESLARELMMSHLEKVPSVTVVEQCANGVSALQAILKKQPDIVFLDVQMPGLSGFEVINLLQADQMPMIVFTTAYDAYAVKAFEMNAVDYLLKPIELQRLQDAVTRAYERKTTEQLLSNKEQLIKAVHNLGADPYQDDQTSLLGNGKLAVSDAGTTNLIPYEDIEWIDAAGDYMCVHANGSTHIIRSTMKNLEAKLTMPFFKRIHRSTMVNFNKVTKIEKLAKGEALLYTEEGTSLKVSRNYRACLEQIQ
jgi:two-component system LytT family response regulator